MVQKNDPIRSYVYLQSKIVLWKIVWPWHDLRDVWVFLCPIYVQTSAYRGFSNKNAKKKKFPSVDDFRSDITQENYTNKKKNKGNVIWTQEREREQEIGLIALTTGWIQSEKPQTKPWIL